MRRLFAEIEIDEEVADRYAETNGVEDSTPVAFLEHEFGWLEQSGITLKYAYREIHGCEADDVIASYALNFPSSLTRTTRKIVQDISTTSWNGRRNGPKTSTRTTAP